MTTRLALVRTKSIGPEREDVATTLYWPGVALAVAAAVARPPAMVTGSAESVAEAPPAEDRTAKSTCPPSIGSSGFLAVTATANGCSNAEPTRAACGVLPATGVSVNPWLSKRRCRRGQTVAGPAGRR